MYGTFGLITVTGNYDAWTQYTREYNADENAAYGYMNLWVQGSAAPIGTVRFDGSRSDQSCPAPLRLPF